MPPAIGAVSGLEENLRLQDRIAQKLRAHAGPEPEAAESTEKGAAGAAMAEAA